MNFERRRILKIFLIIILILLIPLFAMQYTDEVNWKTGDFLVMGGLLSTAALTYEFLARKSQNIHYRIAFGLGLTGGFLLFWVNGAVGIIGHEGQPANWLFGSVFVVGLFGSLWARFKPRGMARTLFLAAFVQMLVPVMALLIWPPTSISWDPGVFGVFALTTFFAILFLVSALLFRRAGTV